MRKPQHQSMTAAICDLARSPGVDYEFISHAEEEMLADDIDRLDVRNALRNGNVIEEQIHDPDMRYVVEGRDTEGRIITIVVELEEFVLRICVVTTWRGQKNDRTIG